MSTQRLRLENVVEQLRTKTGCPWNRRREATQFLQDLLAEVGELKAALDGGIVSRITDELGDCLFNLVAITETFREAGLTSVEEVDAAASDKMIRRHPYVFAGMPDPGPDEGPRLWERIKNEERINSLQNRIGYQLLATVPWPSNGELVSTDRLHSILNEAAMLFFSSKDEHAASCCIRKPERREWTLLSSIPPINRIPLHSSVRFSSTIRTGRSTA